VPRSAPGRHNPPGCHGPPMQQLPPTGRWTPGFEVITMDEPLAITLSSRTDGKRQAAAVLTADSAAIGLVGPHLPAVLGTRPSGPTTTAGEPSARTRGWRARTRGD
jgi:hypothetical protein